MLQLLFDNGLEQNEKSCKDISLKRIVSTAKSNMAEMPLVARYLFNSKGKAIWAGEESMKIMREIPL